MLSDGSKARKTGNEKELVLAWVEKNGIPVYIVAALLEMPDFSVTNAILLKEILDSVFETTNISLLDHQTKLTCATVDGANMNNKREQTLTRNNTLCKSQVQVGTKRCCWGNSEFRKVWQVFQKYFLPAQEFWQT